MRSFWLRVHRYAGLYMALFLVVAGLTGSILAFRPELDEWLNPQFYRVPVEDRPMLDPFALQDRAEALVPNGRAYGVDLNRSPGKVFAVYFEPRIDSTTGLAPALDFTAILLNPYTGSEIERLRPNLWPLTRKNVMSVVLAMHYSLALGTVGLWLFGMAAVIWTLDCFVGVYLTFPLRMARIAGPPGATGGTTRSWWARWRHSWRFTWRGSSYRIQFTLHRAAGLWVWPMLFVLAWSSVRLNLYSPVYAPVMTAVFGMAPEVPKLPQPPTGPPMAWRQARAVGQRLMAEEARLLGFSVKREEALSYDAGQGLYVYQVLSDRDAQTRLGNTAVLFDPASGGLADVFLPTGDNAAQTFTTWITNLHLAMVWRVPIQILVCFMGLVVTMLSFTGVYLWWKKRQARASHRSRLTAAAAP